MYRALIFDFDYTLGDTTHAIAASVNYALARLGYPPHSEEEIGRTVGLSLELAFRMLTGKRDEREEGLFFDYFQVKADEVMTADARLYPDVEEKLRTWGSKYSIAVFSTKHRYRIEAILKKFSLEHAVRAVVGNEDVENEKPHPEGLLRAADLLGADLREVLYVGDGLVDAEAASRAGVDFAAVLTGTTKREEFSAFPHVAVVSSVPELSELLQ